MPPPTLVQRLRSAGLRLERKFRDSTSGKLWLVRHVPDPTVLSNALPAPALRYSSDATGLRGDYAVLQTDAKMQSLKAYALYAEAGPFMVVTRFAASSATAASAVMKLLTRVVHADRYSFLFMEGAVPKPMRTGLSRHTFGQHAGYGYVTDAAMLRVERMMKQRMAATGRKLLPVPNGVKGSKAVRADAYRAYNSAVKRGLRLLSIPTRFVENTRNGRNSSASSARSASSASARYSKSNSESNSNSNGNNGNVRARRRPMLLTLRM